MLGKNKRAWLILLFAFFLAILFGVVWKNLPAIKREQIRVKTLLILRKCKDSSGTLNSLNSACMSENFQDFVTKENIGMIMDTLGDIFQSEDNKLNLGSPSCHAPGHVVGEIARSKGMSLSDFWEICSTKCGYGCLHGGLIGSFGQEGGDFFSNYKYACDNVISSQSDEQLRSCWHVVGHGLGELFGEDIEGAVNKCLELPTAKVSRHCIDGVRMEYITGVSYNPLRENISTETIISFCKRFPPDYQDDCFRETAYYTFRISGEELEAIEVCSQIPSSLETKEFCVFGGGLAFISVYKNSPQEVHDLCRKYGEGFVNECLLGAVHFLVGREPIKDIIKICEVTDSDFLSECLSFLGENLEKVAGREGRNQQCGELEGQKRADCLKKPEHLMKYLEPQV